MEEDKAYLIDLVRPDLRDEVKLFLTLATPREIKGIMKLSDTVKCLEIERLMCLMVRDGRAEENDFPGWELYDSWMKDLFDV